MFAMVLASCFTPSMALETTGSKFTEQKRELKTAMLRQLARS